MIYAVLIFVGLVIPFAVGAWAGPRFDAGVYFLICLALVVVMLGAPLLLLEIMPHNAFPWLEDLFASVALVSFLGSSVIVGEFAAGFFYGRKSLRPTDLNKGFEE